MVSNTTSIKANIFTRIASNALNGELTWQYKAEFLEEFEWSLLFDLSHGIIPEGRSFQESPDGFICLDCGKITNQGHRGTVYGKDKNDLTEVAASTAPHPVILSNLS